MQLRTEFTLFAILALMCAAAKADQFTVTLNTSSLSGVQTLAFALTDNGDGAGNNAATMSGFGFGGGSVVAGTQDCTLGGALSGVGCSGSLSSGVTLHDSLTAFFTQQFNAGSSLSFTLTTTNNFFGIGSPDQFAMYVCDAGFDTCYSDDQATAAMLTLDLTGKPLTPSSFTLNGARQQGLADPVVTTPEPSSLMLLGTGLIGAVGIARKRHRQGGEIDVGSLLGKN